MQLNYHPKLLAHPRAEHYADNARFGFLGRKRLKASVTKKTVNFELQTLSTFFLWTKRQNLLFANPAELVEKFRLPKRSIPKFLTKDELTAFFAACDETERRVFSILFLSGMRKGELLNLRWQDVRYDLRLIQIREKDGWRPKTDERVIPLTPALEAILREQQGSQGAEAWVVSNREGNQETHLLEKLKKVCRRAKISPKAATLHALRHSFGSHLRMAGVPLANIAELMGHRDLSTTGIYAKVEVEHLRVAAGELSSLVDVSPVCVTRERKAAGSTRKLREVKEL